MITGLRPKTFENLQTNAGAFLKNFDWKQSKTYNELLQAIVAALDMPDKAIGATIGGGSFQCTPSLRNVEADGMRYQFVGSTVNDMWTVKLTGTMKEITPQNFKDALICADLETSEDGLMTTLKVRTDIEEGDYIPSLCWVGDTSKGFVLIELQNALNLTGANFTFTDKGEGSLPFEFQAHAKDLADMKYAPVEIVFFDELEPEAAAASEEPKQQGDEQTEPVGEE